MGRRRKATEGWWEHPQASTERLRGQAWCLLLPFLLLPLVTPFPASPLNPLPSLLTTLVPSLASCHCPTSCPCLSVPLSPSGQPMALRSFLLCPFSPRHLLQWVLPRYTVSPSPQDLIWVPLPNPQLFASPCPSHPSSCSTTVQPVRRGPVLAPARWTGPEPGASVPTGP